MIEHLSNYAFSLVTSVFILNIVQMILPENKNRKYILFVTSMIVTIVLIEPIIEIFNADIEVSKILNENQEEMLKISEENYNKYYENEVINQYKVNIQNGIISRLQEMGYETKFIKCEYNSETLEPQYLYLELKRDETEIIPVKIEVINNPQKITNDFTIMEKVQISEVLKREYGVEKTEVVKWKK